MKSIFDTHAHYDDKAFDEDRESLLASLKSNNIMGVVNVCAALSDIEPTLELIEKYDFIYGAMGLHPQETGDITYKEIELIKEKSMHPKIVAVGEIGLDYHWDEPESSIQKKWFEAQLEVAKEIDKPVIIHSRDAAADTYDIMKALDAGKVGGVVHCFSYSKEMAAKYLDMDFYIGIGGVVTFDNAKKLKEVVEYIPLERIVLETDAPYLAPKPHRGTRNSSLNLPYVVSAIAELKKVSKETVLEATWDNAVKMYHLSDMGM
ncbi:MAG: TatD family hydrolase [Lachnospiraceae bacterium]|nr:TatD family hydrolase [Lachnospiraceae bacterium]